jgi:hypothetical protein
MHQFCEGLLHTRADAPAVGNAVPYKEHFLSPLLQPLTLLRMHSMTTTSFIMTTLPILLVPPALPVPVSMLPTAGWSSNTMQADQLPNGNVLP